ncbi:LysR family transcriptional regulator [Belliella pelovolcani]|uniref:Transcriptional regulator, LysR family n=1 Tax=Belliella pelovolcani TaxID=529505 RepID=A0A1N7PNE5_9BACT|nr:LysR substrate-binding domain-containing protein [Belliella pelovolcani]SIT12108.1 transcriptional regulator, LysR family [Belliella pelovolcani]
METKYLKLIKEVYEQGTLVAASDSLFLTPGALSQQLKEAENLLGTKLFNRLNKKMIPTKAGDKTYQSSLKILEELDSLNFQIKDLIKEEKGSILLSTECYTSYHWLPSVLSKYKVDFDGIEVKIAFEATHKPIQKLLQGHIDLAITSDPIAHEKLEYLELFEDEMVAIVHFEHHWASKAFVEAIDFETENLIIHSEPLETVTIYSKLLKPKNIQPKSYTILPLTEASIELVKADMGIMVMANWAINPNLISNEIHTVKISKHGLKRIHYAAVRKDVIKPDYLIQFTKYLRDAIKK